MNGCQVHYFQNVKWLNAAQSKKWTSNQISIGTVLIVRDPKEVMVINTTSIVVLMISSVATLVFISTLQRNSVLQFVRRINQKTRLPYLTFNLLLLSKNNNNHHNNNNNHHNNNNNKLNNNHQKLWITKHCQIKNWESMLQLCWCLRLGCLDPFCPNVEYLKFVLLRNKILATTEVGPVMIANWKEELPQENIFLLVDLIIGSVVMDVFTNT